MLVCIISLVSLVLGWLASAFYRQLVCMREKESGLEREKALRTELQQFYDRECDLHNRLRESYEEQQISILQQKVLLDEVNRLYREEERAAITDPVTGLLNHRAFIQRLDEELVNCKDEQKELLVLFLDIDYFKDVNDTWGHLAGDMVLSEIGRRLQVSVREGDLVSRYGGEEFALLMPYRGMRDAYEEADRLRQAISNEPYYWQCADEVAASLTLTASVGVASYGLHGTQREELIERADLAMYQAKMAGRNCVRVAGMEALSMLSRRTASGSLRWVNIGFEEESTEICSQVALSLSTMMEARDRTTGLHSQRIIRLAEETGKYLQLSEQDIQLVCLGARLHDVGKISMPDTILNKISPLSEEEWRIMYRHPEIGAQILEEIGGTFQRLAPIVAAHHERWDGYGYPQGLRGSDIPLLARILSVVDAYDAMVSRRPYKEPMPRAAARAELRRCAGTQFDATVVNAFLITLEKLDQQSVHGWAEQSQFRYEDRGVSLEMSAKHKECDTDQSIAYPEEKGYLSQTK